MKEIIDYYYILYDMVYIYIGWAENFNIIQKGIILFALRNKEVIFYIMWYIGLKFCNNWNSVLKNK